MSAVEQIPIRLVYVTVSMPFGPGEAFFIPEVNELNKQGHKVLIVPRSPKGGIVNRDAAGLTEHAVVRELFGPSVLIAAALEALQHPLMVARALILLLGSNSPLVLAKNIVVFPKGLWLTRIARQWKANHIHAQWGLTTATMAMVSSNLTGIPWSMTLHRGDIIDNNMLEQKARRANFVRFISKDGIALAKEVCGRPMPGEIAMSHLGVDIPASVAGARPLHSPPILLCPAHLIVRKGQEFLIEALRIMCRRGLFLRLQLAGEGNRRSYLEKLVAEMGLTGTVEFLGQLQHAELLDIYKTGRVDIVVLPTLHEGIPVALMEAMGYGVPVVSTDTGGIPELLRNGAGLIVPPENALALADAIDRVIREPGLAAALGRAGRRRIEEEFAVERTVKDLVRTIRSTSDDIDSTDS